MTIQILIDVDQNLPVGDAYHDLLFTISMGNFERVKP